LTATEDNLPTLTSVREASQRIRPLVHLTPVLESEAISQRVGTKVSFKCENFQKVGAFKFRGACNAVFSLDEAQAQRGFITHSSGNHAQALALAAKLRGARATIVMPDNAPVIKRRAVEGYGGDIHMCESTQAAREATVDALQAKAPKTLVHPYDDNKIIAGQGTAALELLSQAPTVDAIMAPVGGGGLLAGSALAATSVPGVRTFGAEPAQADDAARSFHAGERIEEAVPNTIADGLRTCLGVKNFAIIQSGVSDILTVSEDAIVEAMRLIWERMKVIAEPSGAVPLAVLLEHGAPAGCKHIGLIISGGNVDLDKLPWMSGHE